ncbi:hypothetical protein BKA69DRAFT_1107229, partial [Paraphysoderma sedebokerense]
EPSLEIAEYLIEEGADVNKWEEQIHMSSPLEIACTLRYVEFVKKLLDNGAVLSKNNDNGRSLLTNVAEIICERDVRNHLDIFQCLIEYGAETSKTTNYMSTKRVKDILQEKKNLEEVQKANEQFQELKNQLFDENNTSDVALKEAQNANKRSNELVKQLSDVQSQVAVLTSIEAKLNKRCDDWDSKHTELQSECTTLKSVISEMKNQSSTERQDMIALTHGEMLPFP